MKKTISWDSNVLKLREEKSHWIEFKTEVGEVIDYDDILVVRTKYVREVGGTENVFGVANGKIVWQIEPFCNMFPLFDKDSFSGIRDNDGETFITNDGYGHRYIYDVKTGKIIRYLDWVK